MQQKKYGAGATRSRRRRLKLHLFKSGLIAPAIIFSFSLSLFCFRTGPYISVSRAPVFAFMFFLPFFLIRKAEKMGESKACKKSFGSQSNIWPFFENTHMQNNTLRYFNFPFACLDATLLACITRLIIRHLCGNYI